ncbi:hypothetical protein IC582_019702 [Cucumis melo]
MVGFVTLFSLFSFFLCGKEKTTPFSLILSLSLSKKPTYTTHSLHPSTHFLHPSTHHPIFTTAAPTTRTSNAGFGTKCLRGS